MGMIRRAFLIGGVAAIGGGIFAVQYGDSAARSAAAKLTDGKGGHNFGTWLRIGEDDTVTLYSPHTDIGQGSNTGLAQMLAEELDPDWSKLAVVSAPAESAFANVVLGKGFMADMSGYPGIIGALPMSLLGFLARQLNLQITGGSSALRFTGQHGLRVLGATFERELRNKLRGWINPEIIEEHRRSPLGQHSDHLERILNYFRKAPIPDKYAVYTEVPFQMFRIACAKIGAVGTMRMFGQAFTASVGSIESVMTSDFITDLVTRSTAGPDSTPWVI